MNREFSPLARLLFWDYIRWSTAYDLLCLILLLVIVLVPVAWWADPMVPRP